MIVVGVKLLDCVDDVSIDSFTIFCSLLLWRHCLEIVGVEEKSKNKFVIDSLSLCFSLLRSFRGIVVKWGYDLLKDDILLYLRLDELFPE